eukprot:7135111-Prymnesium_polylepis.1
MASQFTSACIQPRRKPLTRGGTGSGTLGCGIWGENRQKISQHAICRLLQSVDCCQSELFLGSQEYSGIIWDSSGTGGMVSLLPPNPSCTKMSVAFDGEALPWAADPHAGASKFIASAGVDRVLWSSGSLGSGPS